MKHIAIPNSLIFDPILTPSAKRVLLALLTFRWENNRLRKPLRFIAERSGLCYATTRKALQRLEEAGYVTKCRRYEYSEKCGRVVYAATDYCVHCKLNGGYTLIPYTAARRLLRSKITHATFLVWLGLACKQGYQNPHAHPSLRCFAREACLAKSTVCLAVIALSAGQLIAMNHCRNRRGSYSCNCYYIIFYVHGESAYLDPTCQVVKESYHGSTGVKSTPGGSIFN